MEQEKRMIERLDENGNMTMVDYDQAVANRDDDKFLRATTMIGKVWLVINITYAMFVYGIL